MLAVLFTVRTVMGIEFQSVASTSPYLISDLAIDYTRLGMLLIIAIMILAIFRSIQTRFKPALTE